MRRLTSSGSKSQVVVPSSPRPWRLIAPAQNSNASASVVLPAPPCPTSATLRIFAGGKLFIRGHLDLSSRRDGASVFAGGGSLSGNFREHPGVVFVRRTVPRQR